MFLFFIADKKPHIFKMKINSILASLALLASLLSSAAWAIDTIDVLVVYPPSLANSDPTARIATMEQYANKALKNSQANIRYRVVHIQELDIANAKTNQATLSLLRRNEEAKTLRSKYGADLVMMLTPTGPYCGRAYVVAGSNGVIGSIYKPYGYSVVGHSCTTAFAHELGHNLSLCHSYKQNSRGGLYTWGIGHGVDNSFVTNMAYSRAYSGAPKLQLFSNPNLILCKGLPCGIPSTEKEGADATRALNIAGPQIAEWYGEPSPPTIIDPNPNLAPILDSDMATILQGATVKINVLANDSDPEKDPIRITHVTKASNGSVSISKEGIIYTPNKLFVGQDIFEYTVSDDHDNTATEKITVYVGLGVKYQYYEGYWPQLPDFSNLSPKSVGIAHRFTLNKRERKSNYALRFYGKINIPKKGMYTYSLASKDSNCKLIINNQTIVEKFSRHPTNEESGSVYLTAGLHRIEVQYSQLIGESPFQIFQKSSNGRSSSIYLFQLRTSDAENISPIAIRDDTFTSESTTVNIDVLKNDSDPDGDPLKVVSVRNVKHGTVKIIDNSTIAYTPDKGFTGRDSFKYFISDGKDGSDGSHVTIRVASGLAYEYFEGSWNSLPDFATLKPVKQGLATDFSLRERNRDNNFALRYKAKIKIPVDGSYIFFLQADEESRIIIDGSIIAHDTLNSHYDYGFIKLLAGNHDIVIEYFEKHGRENLAVYWGGLAGKTREAVKIQPLRSKDLNPAK